MAHFLSSTSEPHSSLQPSDSGGVKAEVLETAEIPPDTAKRFVELQALNERNDEENRNLAARNLVLEETCRKQYLSLEEKVEQIIKLEEEAMSLKEKHERLNEKYRNLRESSESDVRKWKEEVKKSEAERFRLELEKSKLLIDLQTERRKGDVGGDEVLKRKLEEKDVKIGELVTKNKLLEMEKMKIKEELGGRVAKLEHAVDKWMAVEHVKSVPGAAGMASSVQGKGMKDLKNSGLACPVHGKEMRDLQNSGAAGKACSVQGKGMGDLQNSGPKSVCTPLIEPKKEIIEADVQAQGHDMKKLGSMMPDIAKKVAYTPKSAAPIVHISDDEDEEEEEQIPFVASQPNIKWSRKRKLETLSCSAEKQPETRLGKALPFSAEKQPETRLGKALSFSAEKQPETRIGKALSFSAEKQPETRLGKALSFSAEKQPETRLCKSNGPQEGKLWETAKKMFNALNDSNRCLKSICALYRKRNSLGVWKNGSLKTKECKPFGKRGMELGKRLTDGDPEGRMKQSVADLVQEDDVSMNDYRNIVKLHVDELFEIYNNNMDPLYQP